MNNHGSLPEMEQQNKFRLDFYKRNDFNFKGVWFSYCIIIDEALKRGIRPSILLEKYLQLEKGGCRKLFHWADSTSMSAIAKMICCSKIDTKEFLKDAGLSVPEGKCFDRDSLDDMISYARSLGKIIVIKPDGGDFGHSVHSDVTGEDIPDILKKMPHKYRKIVVERFIPGNEHRVFVTKKGFMAVCMRRPASILGDGRNNVERLVEIRNMSRHDKKSGNPRISPWDKIQIDGFVTGFLSGNNQSLSYVPKKGERVFMRNNSNVSSGGDSIEVTEYAHESVKRIAMKALRAVPGLPYAGIDIITRDITKDISRYYAIIEMNNSPGITLHHYPNVGKPQNVAGALLDIAFQGTD